MTSRRSSLIRSTGPLVSDKTLVAKLEARNALLQFDEVVRLIPVRSGNLRLTEDDICSLQKLVVKDIWEDAGEYRKGEVQISNSDHQPPPADSLDVLVRGMCKVANSHSSESTWVCAYLMWKLNWIHPFPDGNGRTSRAVGYLALCAGFEMRLPGTQTVPDMISVNKQPYYHALDAADAAWAKSGVIDVSQMEQLVHELVVRQLESATS